MIFGIDLCKLLADFDFPEARWCGMCGQISEGIHLLPHMRHHNASKVAILVALLCISHG